MPFIEKLRRKIAHDLKTPTVGDLCFLEYSPMIDFWKDSPRWTSVHIIFRDVIFKSLWYLFTFKGSKFLSLLLAWQVFFVLTVIPYEEEKRKINGDI